MHWHVSYSRRAKSNKVVAWSTGSYLWLWFERTIGTSFGCNREVYTATFEDYPRYTFEYYKKQDRWTLTDRLLDLLSSLLSGQPYKHLGAPTSLIRNDVFAIKDLNTAQVSCLSQLRVRQTSTIQIDEWSWSKSRNNSTGFKHIGKLWF